MSIESPAGCPVHIPPGRERVFDYASDPKKSATPFDAYLEFRGGPAFWSPVSGGFWLLTDAASVRDAYQDATSFSNRNIGLGYSGYPELMIPEQLDAPEHRKYRSLLASWFTPGAATRLEPAIRQTCTEIIDAFAAAGEGDLIECFVGRFPQTVFLTQIIHLPVSELPQFLQWEHAMLRHPQVPAEAAKSGGQLRDYLAAVIAERAAKPLDSDLISSLLQGRIDGRQVTQAEVQNIAFLLFLAGLDTVTAALSFSFHFLATHAEHRRKLGSDPGLITSAVEELLRYHAFVSPVRTATRSMDFHGIPLKEGDRVVASSVLAARDPSEFANPDEVLFDRPANRHMAFGAGPHRCLGSHLARVEMKVALEEFHKRVADYELDASERVSFHAAGVMGVDNLPLRWRLKTEL